MSTLDRLIAEELGVDTSVQTKSVAKIVAKRYVVKVFEQLGMSSAFNAIAQQEITAASKTNKPIDWKRVFEQASCLQLW